LTSIEIPGSKRRVQVNSQAAPFIKGFLDDLAGSGAPIHNVGGYSVRRIAGSNRWSQHSYGGAIDINQSARNVISPDLSDWMNKNRDKVNELERKWGMTGGEHWRNPDAGHWEWGGPNAAKAIQEAVGSVDPRLMGNLPVGMRNFNPANLQYSGPGALSKYFGALGPSKNIDVNAPQIVFDTEMHGMQAAVKLAREKYSQGMTSLNEIIASKMGWTGGNYRAAKNIADTLGIDPNADLQLNNPKNMQKFMRGLLKQEQGNAASRYTDEFIGKAIRDPVTDSVQPGLAKQRDPMELLQQPRQDVQLGRGKVDLNLKLDRNVNMVRPSIQPAENFDLGVSVDRTGQFFARPGDPTYSGSTII
jgi:hypothetical protein